MILELVLKNEISKGRYSGKGHSRKPCKKGYRCNENTQSTGKNNKLIVLRQGQDPGLGQGMKDFRK